MGEIESFVNIIHRIAPNYSQVMHNQITINHLTPPFRGNNRSLISLESTHIHSTFVLNTLWKSPLIFSQIPEITGILPENSPYSQLLSIRCLQSSQQPVSWLCTGLLFPGKLLFSPIPFFPFPTLLLPNTPAPASSLLSPPWKEKPPRISPWTVSLF